ncbi:aldo/keto reductase [Mycolicibacterium sp. S2-37]|uniref:aldo/keto reductase n=1 Tax=Mycolicibacterium sp. S2-37 TaxID=2810297 RepID=UPI001A93FCDB|nr:aldo/keto reductase [Mycolicibacterium sp. S2-37]MBO0678495.1 aldo/keto reductase [Mycolicibacterium sp. S2-37]
MQYLTFGRNNGLRVSEIALGAANFGSRWGYGADAGVARTVFDQFTAAGGTFVDTAASYQVGESEEILGSLLTGRRDDVVVATKFGIGGPDGSGVVHTGASRRAMVRSVEGSLRRLRTDWIDLLWLHFPDGITPVDETVRAFDDLVRAGKVLYVGLSNCPAWLTSRAATLAELRGSAPIAGIQFEYSLVERSGDRENLPMAEALGLGAALWSPLGGGLLTGKYRSGSTGRLTDWNRLVHTEDGGRKTAVVDEVLAIAGEKGCAAAEVAVAWLLERGRRSTTALVPVVGPRSPEQLRSYLAATTVRLDGEEFDRLERVSRISLGEPYDKVASDAALTLGGDTAAVRSARR